MPVPFLYKIHGEQSPSGVLIPEFELMKTMLAFLLFLGIPAVLVAGAAPADWENPAVTAINKEPPHAMLLPFASREQAVQPKPKTPFFKSLNGRWKFNWVSRPDARPGNFFRRDLKVRAAYQRDHAGRQKTRSDPNSSTIRLCSRIDNMFRRRIALFLASVSTYGPSRRTS